MYHEQVHSSFPSLFTSSSFTSRLVSPCLRVSKWTHHKQPAIYEGMKRVSTRVFFSFIFLTHLSTTKCRLDYDWLWLTMTMTMTPTMTTGKPSTCLSWHDSLPPFLPLWTWWSFFFSLSNLSLTSLDLIEREVWGDRKGDRLSCLACKSASLLSVFVGLKGSEIDRQTGHETRERMRKMSEKEGGVTSVQDERVKEHQSQEVRVGCQCRCLSVCQWLQGREEVVDGVLSNGSAGIFCFISLFLVRHVGRKEKKKDEQGKHHVRTEPSCQNCTIMSGWEYSSSFLSPLFSSHVLFFLSYP